MERTLQRQDILTRYRHLREISTRHHNAALDCVARPAMLERAKHLGCTYGQTLVLESEEAMALIFDLAVHTAKPGRSARSIAMPERRHFPTVRTRPPHWKCCVPLSSRSGGLSAITRWPV